jgi:hypothetical protein
LEFIRLASMAAGASVLAACVPQALKPTATSVPAPTAVPTAVPAPTAVVSTAAWAVSGDYFESCSCDYICPCITGQNAGIPSKGSCTFAAVYHIAKGRYGTTALDGLNAAWVGRTPEAMGAGNWSVGVIVDELANAEQQKALAAIFGGQEGGPISWMAPAFGTDLGVVAKPIHYESSGLSRSVSIPDLLDQAIEGVAGGIPEQPVYLDNSGHPTNTKLALAMATHSHLHAFTLNWDDVTGKNNGHFAPFDWTAS